MPNDHSGGPDWDELAMLGDPLRSVIDPSDLSGSKNRLIDSIHWSAIGAHLPRTGSLLDLGCGTGRLARRASGLGLRYTGADTSAEMIAAAKRANSDLSSAFVHYSGIRVPFADGQFDALVTVYVLQHLMGRPEAPSFVSEMRRVVSSGARIVMIEQASHSGMSSAPTIHSSTPDDYYRTLSAHFVVDHFKPVRSFTFSRATYWMLSKTQKGFWSQPVAIPVVSAIERLRIRRLRDDHFRSIKYFDFLISGRAI